MWDLIPKNDTNGLTDKTKTDSQIFQNKCRVTQGETWGEGIYWEFGIDTLLHTK